MVQKFGALPRNIDEAACAAKGVRVLTIRRRVNCACAEMAFALMFALAKKLNRVLGRISIEQLAQVGYPFRPFDRRHMPLHPAVQFGQRHWCGGFAGGVVRLQHGGQLPLML